ncbi:MAG: hypothetical protein WBO55_19690 [Rhizobiaceae bacterium]
MAKKLVVVCEGDSWHRLPDFPFKYVGVGGSDFDIERGLKARGHSVHPLAYWGDTIQEIADRKDYLLALTAPAANLFLVDGGGNDLLKRGRLARHIKLYRKDRPIADYPKASFHQLLDKVMDAYKVIFDDVRKHFPNMPTVCHGYDRPEPRANGEWLSNPMVHMGIVDRDLQKQIAGHLIDLLNERLSRLASKYSKVAHVDLRGVVNGRWHDELHPRKAGFEDASALIEAQALKMI